MKSTNLLVTIFLIVSIFLFYSCKDRDEQQAIGVMAEQAMVVSAHPSATAAGLEVLKKGGNAYDAAVAVHFCLAVAYPRAGNIGGGGFLTYYQVDGSYGFLDFREKAPLKAAENMYQDELGEIIEGLSTKGCLAAGIPGSVMGMYEMHQRLGSLPWEDLLQAAIDLAENGFEVMPDEAKRLNFYKDEFLNLNDSTLFPFFKEGEWESGELIKQKELATTLRSVQKEGASAFYQGSIAEELVHQVSECDGIFTLEDLKEYEAKWRDPIVFQALGRTFITAPPPSIGGILLAQLVKAAEWFGLDSLEHNSLPYVHRIIELEKRSYADRATYGGDADYYEIPVKWLTSNAYLKDRFADLNLEAPTPSQLIKEGVADTIESYETTHYSIVDPFGNAASVTTTINGNYGSMKWLPELGFFLNNEMDDFSIKVGHPNMYGLIGSEANAIQPGKRMLSNMTPTVVLKNDSLEMLVGTPGGSTIITSIYQVILNNILFDMTMQEAVNQKRFHHQWLPDQVLAEKGIFSDEMIQNMEKLGYKFRWVDVIGRTDCIKIHPDGWIEGAADHTRSDDVAMGF